MARSTVHYADSDTNRILKRLHNKLRPAGTPVQRVEYIIELLLLRIFEVKLIQDPEFKPMRAAFTGEQADLLFTTLSTLPNEQILPALNQKFFPFYAKILTAARKVWPGNLSTKVQDQLVLIEEVFSNSNFTNNVNSGNMGEIIGLVAELDSDRLLKTDLLGDAIESALSETGGTKDIGLHRTPDHVRQFMAALVKPTFTDQIFDPTVGTGGFMFDSFEYVMQGVSQDGSWPGPKAHPELIAWFADWFAKHPVPMPTIEASTDFYRTGVGGIEYLGMVRKMAAINFYVRGLNPGNIVQGDALEKFGTEIIPKSKTVILANPPFGAERDKESYPNVWTEYATESETTILFVKLMLESLKDSGRCAAVVSEGFLTWDQNSARALRRALLDECNLQAIISLPQGLFVSKGGQGPKTSILLFTKGGSTKDVWFYKVTNDGYTMGTNRKVQPGCQLVEALDLYHTYVAQGQTPPETRHSFTVPADWIKVLDPRVKDKIRAETRAEMKVKEEEDRAKLTTKLDAQVAAKKITESEKKAKLAEHAEVWLNKTENTIAQKIERAHLYSFNLPNYRSSLTAAQVAAWKDFAATRLREDDPSKTLEQKYRALSEASAPELDELLSALDPRHTLELDLARHFLASLAPEAVKGHPHLQTLQEIIATQQKTPRIALRELLTPVVRPAKLEPDRTYRRVTVKLYGKGVQLRDRVTVDDLKGDKWFVVKAGDLIFSKIDARNGAFGLVPEELDDAIVTNEFPVFAINTGECDHRLLAALITNEKFYGQIEMKVSGASGRRRLEPDELLEMELPLVEHRNQLGVADQVERCTRIRQGVSLITRNLRLTTDEDLGSLSPLGHAVLETKNGWSPRCNGGETAVLTLACLKNGNIDLREIKFTDESRPDLSRYIVREGDFFYSRGNTPDLVALAGIATGVSSEVIFPDLLTRVRFDEKLILREYAVWLFNSEIGRKYFGVVPPGASPSMVKVSQDYMEAFPVPLMGNTSHQQKIIDQMKEGQRLMSALNDLSSAEQLRLAGVLNRIWDA